MGERQQRWLQAIQNRLQSTSEMLKNMKEVRLGGLQELMAEKLRGLREKEVSQSTDPIQASVDSDCHLL